MRKRPLLLIGSAIVVLAAAVLVVALRPRGAPAQPPAEPPPAPLVQAPAVKRPPVKRPSVKRQTVKRPAAKPALPALALIAPEDGRLYASSVVIRGRVPAPGKKQSAARAAVTWALEGTDAGGTVTLSRNGSFTLTAPLAGQHGDLSLVVTATDKDGRTVSVTRTLRERTAGPALEIDSPADHSLFADAVSIAGRVGDPSDPTGAPAEVGRLSWQVEGKPALSGSVDFSADGKFKLRLPAAGLPDELVVALSAEDRNGHSTRKTITLGRQQAPAAAAPAAPVAVQPEPEPPAQPPAAAPSVAVQPPPAPAAVSASPTAAPPVPAAVPVAPPEAPAPQAAPGELPLEITRPADGGYYQASTIIEGRVGTEGVSTTSRLASLSWKIPARAGLTGHAVVNADGTFRLALPFSDLSGEVVVVLTAEEKNGRQTQKTLALHDGTLKPALTVSAPSDGAAFGSLIRVAGRITDPYAGTPGMAGIRELSWTVTPVDYSRHSTPARGVGALQPDNSFRLSVPAAGLIGPQVLTVTARAMNGNESETNIKLVPGDGDVPGFTINPADRKAEVEWQTVPFAVRYDLTYGPAGSPASSLRTVNQVSTPFNVSGLDNGVLYEFHLAIAFDDGGKGTSVTAQAIPLAPETLQPVVKGDYQEIRLTWKTIPGASAYDIWRSLSSDTGWEKIVTSTAAARYVDTAVEFGRDYYYAISPSGPKAPMSAPGSGKTVAFPADKLALVGSARMEGTRRITIDGGYAFVAAGARGVSIVDVSNPKAPVVVGRVDTRDAHHVVVRGEYAYVADGDAGLRVLDITNPRAPEIIGSCKTSDAQAVALSGNYAYVADGTKGLKVIDISDARTLPRVAFMETTDARDVAVSGDRLFIADGAGGLKILSLAKPLLPGVIASLAAADARGVAVFSGAAVLAGGAEGLRIVNVKNPGKPVEASSFESGMAASAATDGRFAYLTDGEGAIKVVDIKDPSHPSLFTAHPVNGPLSVAVAGRYAYIADAAGLDVMRIQIYGQSFRVASAETGGKAFQVALSGDWAYVASHAQGIKVVSVRDPVRVTNASAVAAAASDFAEAVTVEGKLAFVADGSAGVRIFDVSPAWADAPSAPVPVGAYRTGGSVHKVALSGTFAFAANGDLGLRILEVSNPAAPVETGELRTDDARDVAVMDGVAWVADGDSGLRVIDVSDPAHPTAVSRPLPGNASSLALNGKLLLVGGTGGVRIFSINDPRAPRLEGRYDTDSVAGLSASGRYACVAEGYRGVTVLDVSKPGQPVVVSTCADVFATSVAMKGDYVLVTDSFGLRVVRILVPEWLAQ